jgi:sugar (pentulose or hexulose) kinase
VVCPITQEAGALGAALQALWCYTHARGEKTSLKEITDAFVSLDSTTSAEPNPQNVKVYDEIYGRYLELDRQLRRIYI